MNLNPFKKRSDPLATSRYEGMFRSVSVRGRKKPFIFRHRWAWVSLLVLCLILGAAGYGYYRYQSLAEELQDETVDPPQVPNESKDPFNVLLVGSDSRKGLTEKEQQEFGADDVAADGSAVTGQRADTLIVAHIDPDADRITMVQFPRDLYVPLASGGQNKINEALEMGINNMIKTVEDLTGITINHYAQVNIAGFRDIVDAIDGVKICLTEPIPFDPNTGLEITEEELPLVPFDGERALRFVRSRSFATGDFARIQNQQKFLSAAVNKVTSVGTLLSPGRINSLLNAVSENVKVDKHLSPKDLYDLGQRFRSFDPDRYEAYTAPNLGLAENDAGSVVLPDLETMEVMFEAIRNNSSPEDADNAPDIDPRTVSVRFYNGTFEDGVAGEAERELLEAIQLQGKTVETVDPTNADRIDYKRTVVRYDPEAEDIETKLELMKAAIPGVEFKSGGTLGSEDFSIIVGNDGFSAEKVVQITPIKLPPPGEVPAECR